MIHQTTLPDSPINDESEPLRGFARVDVASRKDVVLPRYGLRPIPFRSSEDEPPAILEQEHRRNALRGHGAQLSGIEEPTHLSEEPETQDAFTQGTQRTVATSTVELECLLSTDDARADPTPVLGYRTPKSTQWRPHNPHNIDQRIATMLDNTLRSLAEVLQPTRPRYKTIAPRFEGAEWEDPHEFLRAIERYCLQENYHSEEWTLVAADQLRGEACRWFEGYRHFHLSFDQLKLRLLEKYDNVAVRSRLQAKLYGQKQGREDATIFITQKLSLYRRLMPELQEKVMVQQIMEMLDPEIRMALRGANIFNISQLTQLAAAIEVDLREINRRPSAALQPVNNLTYSADTQLVRRQAQRPPPYPCRYCQGNHFHRDCLRGRALEPPRERRASDNVQIDSGISTSENSRRAALPPAMAPRPQQ